MIAKGESQLVDDVHNVSIGEIIFYHKNL